MDNNLQVRFTGSGMKPGLIRSKEIAQIIESFEEMVVATVLRENPELKRETLVVGLTSITDESLGLQFTANATDLMIPAAARIITAIAANNVSHLPSATISAIRHIKAFVARHDCEAEMKANRVSGPPVTATITAITDIPSVPAITGETTLYGEISRVGGTSPRVQFKSIAGELIYFDITAEMARQLGSKLYTRVALHGQARWNSDTLEIEDFKIHEIAGYKNTSLKDAFVELRKISGSVFDDIENVEQFATDLRRGTT